LLICGSKELPCKQALWRCKPPSERIPWHTTSVPLGGLDRGPG